MPTYVYRCQQCGAVLEKRQSFSDAPLTVCESCGGELRKVLQPAGIIFRGSGFYSTDYKAGGASKSSESRSGSESGSGEKSEKSETVSASTSSSSSNDSKTSTSSSSPSKSD